MRRQWLIEAYIGIIRFVGNETSPLAVSKIFVHLCFPQSGGSYCYKLASEKESFRQY